MVKSHNSQVKKRMVSTMPTSGPRSLDLNLDTKSCVVTGATARRTLLISSSVTGDTFVPLFDEADIFGAGFAEDDASSLRPDAFVSYTKSNNYLHTEKINIVYLCVKTMKFFISYFDKFKINIDH